ncbi:NAD(P)H-dependent oxidoreductase [Sulfurovum sp. XGS-02]|uniref:NAD(P)H-dependent oxidoreductase n=1 Tax=Sulfurovum sp. XGS-02 TaxID=2925411 RepID=UPI00206C5027|nr:NAD(P)H-dependent oxidoreductase [Sulfurovum sp. XGS-02]UPT78275.1 NAD(P)H-dependent oxidoreductase [Sulfurovum sp. XGS-02]
MKNVLIINGHQRYDKVAEGRLTKLFVDTAGDFFTQHGFNVKESMVEGAYDVQDELDKLAWADYILFQYPVFWMGVPWITKKYIDEVFSAGMNTVTYVSDGRSKDDPSKKYGSGGLMQGKKYMLSLTYNCPESEFDNKEGFFDGLSLDEANVATHKLFQFCGAEPLETYAIHDVFKENLDVDAALKRFKDTLERNFMTSR